MVHRVVGSDEVLGQKVMWGFMVDLRGDGDRLLQAPVPAPSPLEAVTQPFLGIQEAPGGFGEAIDGLLSVTGRGTPRCCDTWEPFRGDRGQ